MICLQIQVDAEESSLRNVSSNHYLTIRNGGKHRNLSFGVTLLSILLPCRLSSIPPPQARIDLRNACLVLQLPFAQWSVRVGSVTELDDPISIRQSQYPTYGCVVNAVVGGVVEKAAVRINDAWMIYRPAGVDSSFFLFKGHGRGDHLLGCCSPELYKLV